MAPLEKQELSGQSWFCHGLLGDIRGQGTRWLTCPSYIPSRNIRGRPPGQDKSSGLGRCGRILESSEFIFSIGS